MKDKIQELLGGIDARELASVLGTTYNGAKKKLSKGYYTIEDFDKLLKYRGYSGIFFRK